MSSDNIQKTYLMNFDLNVSFISIAEFRCSVDKSMLRVSKL